MNRCDCGDSECRWCGTAQGTIAADDAGHGHWPVHIVELMRGRNVLTVALDLVGGVRGANDLCLSECANAMTVLEWYLKKWEPSDCLFDKAVHDCITTAHALAEQWFRRPGVGHGHLTEGSQSAAIIDSLRARVRELEAKENANV